jgi:hypothetical protein
MAALQSAYSLVPVLSAVARASVILNLTFLPNPD